MSWLVVKLHTQDHQGELVSETLMNLGAISSAIEDANADTPDEQAIFGEPGDPPPGIWQQNIVSAMFTSDTDVPHILQQLFQALAIAPLPYSIETLEEQDWVRLTQSQFDPIRISDTLWIVPSWHTAPSPEAINIQVDPGLAFGTGSHPTTHLCLQWLERVCTPEQTVLDYGCGSGILAIAAKKLGAKEVFGTDIDPQAIQSSHDNASANACDISFYLPKQLPSLQTDIVVANILSGTLSVLAPALAEYCKIGGMIALSGILKSQAEDISAIYAEWFNMHTPIFLDDWTLLTGTKR